MQRHLIPAQGKICSLWVRIVCFTSKPDFKEKLWPRNHWRLFAVKTHHVPGLPREGWQFSWTYQRVSLTVLEEIYFTQWSEIDFFTGKCIWCQIQNKVHQRKGTRMVKSEEYGIWNQKKDPAMFKPIYIRLGGDTCLSCHESFIKIPAGPSASLGEVDVCCSCLSNNPLSSRRCHSPVPYVWSSPQSQCLISTQQPDVCYPHTTMIGQGNSVWLKQSQPKSSMGKSIWVSLPMDSELRMV